MKIEQQTTWLVNYVHTSNIWPKFHGFIPIEINFTAKILPLTQVTKNVKIYLYLQKYEIYVWKVKTIAITIPHQLVTLELLSNCHKIYNIDHW